MLKNVSRGEVHSFLEQVELVPMIGEESADSVAGGIRDCAARDPGAYPYPFRDMPIKRVQVPDPKRLILDQAGYFVVYPDVRAKRLFVEHYTNEGLLDCVLEGNSTGALYSEAIERQLLTRLDHAAYLGRELARAERSLLDGTSFVQDAAPGEIEGAAQHAGSTDQSCGCARTAQAPSQTKGC